MRKRDQRLNHKRQRKKRLKSLEENAIFIINFIMTIINLKAEIIKIIIIIMEDDDG